MIYTLIVVNGETRFLFLHLRNYAYKNRERSKEKRIERYGNKKKKIHQEQKLRGSRTEIKRNRNKKERGKGTRNREVQKKEIERCRNKK